MPKGYKVEREYNAFYCETCDASDSSPRMTQEQAIEHLSSVHKLTLPAKGLKTMLSHIDGADFYTSMFRWEYFPNIVLTQEVQSLRRTAEL